MHLSLDTSVAGNRLQLVLAAVASFGMLEFLALLNSAPNDSRAVVYRGSVAIAFSGAAWAVGHITSQRRSLILGLGAFASLILYVLWPRTSAAWIATLTLFVFVTSTVLRWDTPARVLWRFVGSLVLGIILVLIAEVQGRFSDEEILAAVQALELGLFIFIAQSAMVAHLSPRRTFSRFHALAVVTLCTAALGVGSLWTARAYQSSFFPETAPGFEGITPEMPSLCGTVASGAETHRPDDTFRRLISAVDVNPRKGAPEYGMLAVARNDVADAQAFRQALISDARAGNYTGPSGSVKYGQAEAALRAHFYSRVREKFPDLFGERDQRIVADWFAAINRRAMTVEWVDVLYAAAFSEWPVGPYENQENGVGLLSVLETTGLHDQALSASNRAYLDARPRGWSWRFRNTDDSYGYQVLWLTNAQWYANYAPKKQTAADRRQAFEWLLEQTMPDGTSEGYNPPGRMYPASLFYLGALWLQDPRFAWLTNAALDSLEAAHKYLVAQPFIETAVDIPAAQPTTGSCLQYGSSGLPTQDGPLAPDKVILRDGWSDASRFMLLNLRFTGWHRYKATNTVVSLNQGGPLVHEAVEPKPLPWLPRGRSALRDKRIAREQLNGVQVESDGFAGVFAALGIASRWAQDPPSYARVVRFEVGGDMQVASTVIDNWNGWRQQRTVYFQKEGVVIVHDIARGSAGKAAVTWHVTGDGARDGDALWLRTESEPAQLIFPADAWVNITVSAESTLAMPGQSVVYYSPRDGDLDLATVFLTGPWVGATVQRDGATLRVSKNSRIVEVNLELDVQ